MGKGEVSAGLRLGRRRLPPLSVPGELFELYQPMIGSDAVMAWLNLRWLIHEGDDMTDIEGVLRYRFGMTYPSISNALQKLVEFELLEGDGESGYVVHEPLSTDAFFPRFSGDRVGVEQPPLPTLWGHADVHEESSVRVERPLVEEVSQEDVGSMQEVAVAAVSAGTEPHVSPTPIIAESESTDLGAVIQIYHRKIGMIGPTQMEKLRFWVEEQGMEAEVVALAIEETVASARNPRINYLEGILKNWYNSGIRTLTDLMNDKYASQVLHPRSERGKGRSASNEGAPNATAYQSVSPDLVDRWKELYPDEYE